MLLNCCENGGFRPPKAAERAACCSSAVPYFSKTAIAAYTFSKTKLIVSTKTYFGNSDYRVARVLGLRSRDRAHNEAKILFLNEFSIRPFLDNLSSFLTIEPWSMVYKAVIFVFFF